MFVPFFFRFSVAPSVPSMSHLSHFFFLSLASVANFQLPNVVFLLCGDEVKKENRRICNKCVRCSNTIRIHKLWRCEVFALCYCANSIFWNCTSNIAHCSRINTHKIYQEPTIFMLYFHLALQWPHFYLLGLGQVLFPGKHKKIASKFNRRMTQNCQFFWSLFQTKIDYVRWKFLSWTENKHETN